jgi:hypothetical protein
MKSKMHLWALFSKQRMESKGKGAKKEGKEHRAREAKKWH